MVDKRDVKEVKNFGENLAGNESIRKRVGTYVEQQIKAIIQGRGYLESKWIMLERLWRGDPISRFYPDANRTTHVPEPFKAVESLIPRIKAGLFPTEDWFRPVPLGKNKGDTTSIKVLMKQQLEDGGFDKNFEMYLRSLLIQGTSFAKTPYIYDEDTYYFKERKKEPVYQDSVLVGNKEGEVVKKEYTENRDYTQLKPLEIFDFIADPRYGNPVKDAPGCGDRTRQNKEYLYAMVEKGIYTNLTSKEIEELASKQSTYTMGLGEDLKYRAVDTATVKRNSEDDIMITEWWGLVPLKEDGKRVPCVVTLIEGTESKCVRIQENKLWHHSRPYVYDQYIPIKGELYGLGVIEPIVYLQQDLNDMRNTMNVGVALTANPMLIVGDDANVEDEQVEAAPGFILRASDIGQVKPLHVPDMSRVAAFNESLSKQDIVETTGTTRLYYGSAAAGDASATEVHTRTRESNMRVKSVINNIARGSLSRFLEICHYNNHQFMEEERIVVLTGEMDGFTHYSVTPDKLFGPAKFVILTAPQIELLGVRGQQMMAFMTQAMANPVGAQAANWTKLYRTAWTDLFGTREVDELFPDTTQELVSQTDENFLLVDGTVVNVKPEHNHVEHARILEEWMMNPEFEDIDPDAQATINSHYKNHMLAIERLQDQATNPANQQQQPEEPGAGRPMPALGGGGQGRDGTEGTSQALANESRVNVRGY